LPNPFTIGFSIQVPNPQSGEASVHWQVLAPAIGDGPTQVCDVSIYAQIPYATTTKTMPLSELLSTDPQTFTYSDSIHFDQAVTGKPASIDYDWTYAITVQRI